MRNHIKSVSIQTWNNATTVRFDRVNGNRPYGTPRKPTRDSMVRLERMIEEGKLSINFIHYGSDGTSTMILTPVQKEESFPITSLSREDIETAGYDPASLTDAQMQEIASSLGSDYVAYNSFWDDLRDQAISYNLPKLESVDEDED